MRLSGVAVRPIRKLSKYSVVSLYPEGDGLAGALKYDPDWREGAAIDGFVAAFAQALTETTEAAVVEHS